MEKEQKELNVMNEQNRTVTGGVSTFGWDTTFTVNYATMNHEIKKESTYPEEFNNTANVHEILDYMSGNNDLSYYQLLKQKFSDALDIKLQGKWGQWQLEMAGSGSTVCLRLPIDSGTIGYGENTADLSEGYLIVDVDLVIENTKKTNSESQSKLMLKQSEENPVLVKNHHFPNMDPDGIFAYIIEEAFQRYLNRDKVLDQFRYVFSTIDINDKATGDFAWLKPSDTGYAVSIPRRATKETDCLFSLLCMTENTKASPLNQWAVDNGVFLNRTKDADAVLCISPQKLCEKILITAATRTIVGTKQTDYEYSSSGMEIHNIKKITFKNVELSGGDKVDMEIAARKFSLKLQGDTMLLTISDASFSKPLYNAYVSINQTVAIDIEKKDGKTIFVPRKGDEFKGDIHVVVEPSETAEIIKWVGVGIDIVASLMVLGGAAVKGIAKCVTTATAAVVDVTGAVAGAGEVATATVAATEGIAAGTGAARAITIANRLLYTASILTAIGLPLSILEVIAVEIGKGKLDKVPAIEDFAQSLLSSFAWTGIKKTELVGARLNDALLLDFKMEE